MILKKTNIKHNDNDTGSYDIVNEKGEILFSVKTAQYRGYRYYEGLCGIETFITKVKAHFDTKGKDAHLLLYKMLKESEKEEAKLQQKAKLKKQAILRSQDPKWKEVCQKAQLLVKQNMKKQAQKIVKNYLENQRG